MIFLDSSALYALTNDQDRYHGEAAAAFHRLTESGDAFLVHNYVLLEAMALLQRRLGLGPALQVAEQSQAFLIHWITQADHQDAMDLLKDRSRRRLSLVDCASFVVMRRYGVTQALAYDGDFASEGFALV